MIRTCSNVTAGSSLSHCPVFFLGLVPLVLSHAPCRGPSVRRFPMSLLPCLPFSPSKALAVSLSYSQMTYCAQTCQQCCPCIHQCWWKNIPCQDPLGTFSKGHLVCSNPPLFWEALWSDICKEGYMGREETLKIKSLPLHSIWLDEHRGREWGNCPGTLFLYPVLWSMVFL